MLKNSQEPRDTLTRRTRGASAGIACAARPALQIAGSETYRA